MIHLFLDNHDIEMVQDLTRRVYQPRKMDDPLLVPDRPWEHIPYFGNYTWTILRDKEAGLFRCWYEDWVLDPVGLADSMADITDPSISKCRLCYAVSEDGLHWEKPALGLISEGGHDTNIILGDSKDDPEKFGSVHSATIIDDKIETDASRRFKMLFQHICLGAPDEYAGSGDAGAPQVLQSPIRAAYSADGIHWTLDDRRLNFGGVGPKLGDVLILGYDHLRREYVLDTRHPHAWNPVLNPKLPRTRAWSMPYYPNDPIRLNKRRVFRTVSRDFQNWSLLNLMLTTDDDEDNLDESFYALRSFRVGELELGLAGTFQSVENVVTPQLVYRRDTGNWRRAGKRQPILPLGDAGAWDEWMVVAPCEPIRVGDEHWLYYGGSNSHHDWWITGLREGLELPEVRDLGLVRQGIGLARMRVNGFVSLHANSVREGLLITKPVAVTGRHLEINAVCGDSGSLRVELSDENDDVLDRFSAEDFDSFSGDAVAHRCRWKGRDEFSTTGSLKLRFWLRNADLYSFEWVS